MTLHVFANVVTPFGTAANNRGETEGNTTTLQKLIWMGLPHTTISAEAIRFALRRLLAEQEAAGTNRSYDEAGRVNRWKDPDFATWADAGQAGFIDDDLLGFMSAEAARAEAEAEGEAVEVPEKPGKKGKARTRAKGKATIRRGVLELTRAVSLTHWPGDMVFNAASPGATPSAAKGEGDNPVPYGAEVHATRYQYGLAMTPGRLRDPSRAAKALRALAALHTVAGNHGRFLFDFAPESLVLRVTHDPAPRLLYCFHTDDDGRTVLAPALEDRIARGDVDPRELILGGPFADSEQGKRLQGRGAFVPAPAGVRAAVEEAVRRIEAGG
nr:CRISPR-associated fruiting body developmental protein R [uncultured bacterium]